MDAGGMGNTIDVAGNGLRMGLPGKGGGMGSPNLRAQTTSNSMGRQRDIINYGTGAGMGQRLAGNTLSSALSWERAALAWEKAAASQESEITRKNGKKSCGCGSAPH